MFEVVADEEVAALIYLGYNCSMQGNVVDTLEDVEGWEGGVLPYNYFGMQILRASSWGLRAHRAVLLMKMPPLDHGCGGSYWGIGGGGSGGSYWYRSW